MWIDTRDASEDIIQYIFEGEQGCQLSDIKSQSNRIIPVWFDDLELCADPSITITCEEYGIVHAIN